MRPISGAYVEGSLGRWFPVTKAGSRAPSGRTTRTAWPSTTSSWPEPRSFEFTKNYKFTTLNNENVWAKAMNRVLSEKVPVDKAVDEMIARIKVVAN
jgi:multiple sugar transport system substrate-binding protein